MGAPGDADAGSSAGSERGDERMSHALHRADRLRIRVAGTDDVVPPAAGRDPTGTGGGPGDVIRAFAELHRSHTFNGHVRPEAPPWPPIPPPDPRTGDRGDEAAPDVPPPDAAPGPAATRRHRRRRRPTADARAGTPDAARGGPEGAAAPRRSRWASRLEARLGDLAAVAVASGALVAPWSWLVVVSVGTGAVGAALVLDAGRPASALPGHVLRRAAALLHPRSLVWAPVLVSRTVLVAVLVPGAVAAAAWALEEGVTGAAAAARAGVWTHGFRVAAALVCLMVVAGVGDGRRRRSAAARRWVRGLTDGRLVAAAGGCVAVTLLVVIAAPRPDDVLFRGADGLGWVPASARVRADGVRDDIVGAELHALASCLSQRGTTIWSPSYTAGNPLDAPDVARLTADGDRFGGLLDSVTAAVAAHNQLAPWVETIEIARDDTVLFRTERAGLPRSRPLTDATELAAATTGHQGWLTPEVAVRRATVLRCSAGPVL